jgi:hypothetical protein
VNWPALIAELTALHGTVPSVTPPAPVPTPTPVPSSGCWGAWPWLFGR